MADDYHKKLSDKQMEIWKQDLTIKSLSQQIVSMTQEISRLKKCKDLSESIARLPSACLDDLTSDRQMEDARTSALQEALEQMKGSEFDKVTKEIEDIQNKSKRAYVRLYEQVGQEIGLSFLDKLDHLTRQKSEADRLIEES